MGRTTTCFSGAMWALFAVLLAASVRAGTLSPRYGFGPPGSGNSNGPFGSSGNNGNNGFGFSNGFPFGPGFDIQKAVHYRTIHGILAALAFVILFPIGSIFMRVIPGRFAIYVHALTQMLGYCSMIAAVALGIYLVKTVQIPFGGGSLLNNETTKYHPIVGLVTFITLLIQPLLGMVHHSRFKVLGRRTFWSHMHIWNGRFGVTVGIINGGLGLQLANAPRNIRTAYTAVAAVMWALWMISAVVGEIRRRRRGGAPVVVVAGGRGAPVPGRTRGVRATTPKESREVRRSSRGSRGSGSASDRA